MDILLLMNRSCNSLTTLLCVYVLSPCLVVLGMLKVDGCMCLVFVLGVVCSLHW